jgi:hypothetical protein
VEIADLLPVGYEGRRARFNPQRLQRDVLLLTEMI